MRVSFSQIFWVFFFLKRSERKMWVLVREREEEEEDLKCEVVKKKKGFGLEVNNF